MLFFSLCIINNTVTVVKLKSELKEQMKINNAEIFEVWVEYNIRPNSQISAQHSFDTLKEK